MSVRTAVNCSMRSDVLLDSFPANVLERAFCPSSTDKTRFGNLLKSVKANQWALVFINSGSASLPSASNSGFRFIRG